MIYPMRLSVPAHVLCACVCSSASFCLCLYLYTLVCQCLCICAPVCLCLYPCLMRFVSLPESVYVLASLSRLWLYVYIPVSLF